LIRIYDTLSSSLKELKTIEKNHVKIYVCGPTVYNIIHVGNARPMIVFDSFRRFLEFSGYKVTMVQNFTDIDDKIINKSNEENTPFKEIPERFINEYWKDSNLLNIRPANFHPKTTDYVDEIIIFIEDLIKKGYAYKSENNDVYFDVRKLEDYGKLSHRNPDDMRSGSRIEISENKRDPLDFTLWKASKENEPSWSSPWGDGRPGWHIECSVMSTQILGKTFDIHAGGNDLIFPHHENERAQSVARHGCEFANYWMHNGMLKLSGSKMSKSTGNIWLVRDIVKQYGADTLKIFMLSKHYRSPLDFSEEGLISQKKSVDRLNETLKKTEDLFENDIPYLAYTDYMKEKINIFKEYLSDDFNTTKAIALIFDISKELNKSLEQKNKKNILENYHLLKNIFGPIFGIFEDNYIEKQNMSSDEVINLLIDIRNKMRNQKNYEMSDYIRDKLNEIGIEIKDNIEGTTYKIK
jgi:cysteinyl-tRNA synthetase